MSQIANPLHLAKFSPITGTGIHQSLVSTCTVHVDQGKQELSTPAGNSAEMLTVLCLCIRAGHHCTASWVHGFSCHYQQWRAEVHHQQ